MTLQHEATNPIPEGPLPSLPRALNLVLRELDQVIAPELQSERARSTAGMLSQLLRHLIIRETSLSGMIDDWTKQQEALLRELDVTVGTGEETGLERYRMVTEAITAEVVKRVDLGSGSGIAGLTDDWSRRAVTAEREHLGKRLQAERDTAYIQHPPEQAARLEVTPERLATYLATKLAHRETVSVTAIHKLLGGFSKETYIIDTEIDGVPKPVVMRRDVPYGAVAGSVIDEVPLLRALFAEGLPVPEALVAETDRSIFGEAFSITRKASGETAFSNVRGLNLTGDQGDAARALAEVLGRLHSLDAKSLDLPKRFFDPALSMADCVLREIEFYEQGWLSRTNRASPTMSAAFAWLRANLPRSGGRPCIVHGDAGLHNLMMDQGKVSVMLDWEMAHMGDPVEDLAYCRTWVDQALPWDEFLATYYKHGGVEYRPEYEGFYSVLSNLRIVVFAAQSGYGGEWTDHPELAPMFATNFYAAVFTDKVAKQLAGG